MDFPTVAHWWVEVGEVDGTTIEMDGVLVLEFNDSGECTSGFHLQDWGVGDTVGGFLSTALPAFPFCGVSKEAHAGRRLTGFHPQLSPWIPARPYRGPKTRLNGSRRVEFAVLFRLGPQSQMWSPTGVAPCRFHSRDV